MCAIDVAASSSLWNAVKANDVSDATRILAGGDLTELDTRGSGGQTALMYSVLTGKYEMVKLLVSHGADTSIPEKDGYTPMHGAGFQGRAEIAKYLITKAGLDPSDQHRDGFAPLHRACWGASSGHTETVRVLLEAGVPVDLASADGKLPIDLTQNSGTALLLKEWKEKQSGVDDTEKHTGL